MFFVEYTEMCVVMLLVSVITSTHSTFLLSKCLALETKILCGRKKPSSTLNPTHEHVCAHTHFPI